MTDYWSKLELNECWSEKQRYNKIMNYIDKKLSGEEEVVQGDDETVETVDIQVSVKDTEEQNVSGVSVVLTANNEEYSCQTGTAGGCKISKVPLGEYSVSATATGFVELSDTLVVTEETESLSLVLTAVEEPEITETP